MQLLVAEAKSLPVQHYLLFDFIIRYAMSSRPGRAHHTHAVTDADADPAGAAAAVADHAFFQYERALQREADPELLIQLPLAAAPAAKPSPAAQPSAGPHDPQRAAPAGQPAAELSGEVQPAAASEAPAAASLGAGGGGTDARRMLAIGVEYEAGGSGGGMCFWGSYARSAHEVRRE